MSDTGVAQLLLGSDPPEWWKKLFQRHAPSTLPANRARPLDREPNPQAVLDRLGYLPQQRGPGYQADWSRKAYETIDPLGNGYYETTPLQRLREAEMNIRHGSPRPGIGARPGSPEEAQITDRASEDAWAMYLGLPQRFRSFEASPFKPSRASNPHQIYLRLPTLWTIIENSPLHDDTPDDPGVPQNPGSPTTGNGPNSMSQVGVARVLQFLGQRNSRVVLGDRFNNNGSRQDRPGTALAHFTLSKGQDEHGHYLSYYDVWDLDAPGAGKIVGRPFEVYDRVYYDPRTLRPLPDPQQRRRRP